jgi:ceroid-lipofuscinosis protein 8
MLASTDESWMFISVVTGFFIFEELTLIYFDVKYRTFSKELHLHHFFGCNGYFIVGYCGRGHFYSVIGFILEGSTPFSCICWCLLKLKLENTKVWKINQWILINVFHLRSVFEFWWWYTIYQDWDQIKQYLPWAYIINMLVGLTIVSLWLTPYWTYKKTAQFFHPIDWNAEKDKEKKQHKIDKTS